MSLPTSLFPKRNAKLSQMNLLEAGGALSLIVGILFGLIVAVQKRKDLAAPLAAR